MNERNSRIVVALIVLVVLVLGVSCNYIPYKLPDAGKPIHAVADPNKGISRELDGENIYPEKVDANGVVERTCSYRNQNDPYMKTLRILEVDGKEVFKTFTTVFSGKFQVGSAYSQYAHRYATTNELTGELVELRYDVNPGDFKGMQPIPDVLLEKLPDVSLEGKTLKEFIQKAPQYGTWELVIGDEKSAWNASVEYMPQEIAAYFEKAGYKDLDERDGSDGMRYYRYDLKNGINVYLTRYLRVDWLVPDQNDMTTVTFEIPTDLALDALVPLFHVE